ncbi:MAG TPA: GNAT family N-acetyltransferase [Hyphomicrobiales bacterium]|nr:GNAT family N-acetyltransferase [Hyphomicrobiales bacterium]
MDLQKCKAAVLTTERLQLRTVRADDAGDIIRLANDFEVARRLARMPHPYGEGDAQHFIKTILPNEAVWALVRQEDGVFMGVVGLMTKSEEDAATIGYWLGRDYWGQGYMTEAATAVARFAFETLKLPYLRSGHLADNAASASVLAKLGFVPVGKSRNFCLALNAEVDHVDLRLDAKDFLYKQTADAAE